MCLSEKNKTLSFSTSAHFSEGEAMWPAGLGCGVQEKLHIFIFKHAGEQVWSEACRLGQNSYLAKRSWNTELIASGESRFNDRAVGERLCLMKQDNTTITNGQQDRAVRTSVVENYRQNGMIEEC